MGRPTEFGGAKRSGEERRAALSHPYKCGQEKALGGPRAFLLRDCCVITAWMGLERRRACFLLGRWRWRQLVWRWCPRRSGSDRA